MKLKKASMNINERTINNIEKISELTGEKNKTRVIAIALELPRKILEMNKDGQKIIIRKGKIETEMTFLF